MALGYKGYGGARTSDRVVLVPAAFHDRRAIAGRRLALLFILIQSGRVKKIVETKALPGFRLWLRFNDGLEGVANLDDLAGKGVFTAWNEAGVFEQVKVTDFGAVAWGEEIDLCPDALYLRVTGDSPEKLFPALSETTAHA